MKGISEAEVARIVEARDGGPYVSLSDFFHRARVSRPVLERLVLAGGFDGVYGIGAGEQAVHRRGRVTRRDLLLQVAELDLHARVARPGLAGPRSRAVAPAGAAAGHRRRRRRRGAQQLRPGGPRGVRPGRSGTPWPTAGCGPARPPSRGPPGRSPRPSRCSSPSAWATSRASRGSGPRACPR